MTNNMSTNALLLLCGPIRTISNRIPSIFGAIKLKFPPPNQLYIRYQPANSSVSVPFTSNYLRLVNAIYSSANRNLPDIDVNLLVDNVTNHTVEAPTIQPIRDELSLIIGTNIRDYNIKEVSLNVSRSFRQTNNLTWYNLNENDNLVQLTGTGETDSTYQNQELLATDLNEGGLTCLEDSFGGVVLGGTFDRLHNGHKLLLTESSLRARRRLVCGVTSQKYIAGKKSKTLPELIESETARIRGVSGFLRKIKPGIELSVVPIDDPFGPSTVDPDLQAIVVSEETQRGGEAVNRERASKLLNVLEIHCISMLADSDGESASKASSSAIRKGLLGRLLKPPLFKRDSNDGNESKPYVVGLTGGMGSGKSSVAKRLVGLGAWSIDCDSLGHSVYTEGSPVYRLIIEEFGSDIVNEDKSINRRVLGRIVFNDKEKLNILNSLVWPHIAELVSMEIDAAGRAGAKVCVLDAAVLLEAGWDSLTNEVWVVVVPKEEMVMRIRERDTDLSLVELERRLANQMSNFERVDHGNVVLSTLWSYEETQQQVEKAWSLLMGRITN